jgi:hypothetical protein
MPAATSYQLSHDPYEIVDLLAEIDLHPAGPDECDAGRAIAADLISPHVALAITLRRTQERTGSAVFVYRQDAEITGVLAILPLRPEGLDAVERHLFDAKNPPDALLCAPGDPLASLYGWGFSGRTRKASALMLTGALRLREHLHGIPFFTRAATPAGAKVLHGRMGYVPYPGAPDDLLWNPIRPSQERAA